MIIDDVSIDQVEYSGLSEEARKKAREEAQKSLGVTKKSSGLFKSMAKSIAAVGVAAIGIRTVFNVFKNNIY